MFSKKQSVTFLISDMRMGKFIRTPKANAENYTHTT